jgi:hypothetical protein
MILWAPSCFARHAMSSEARFKPYRLMLFGGTLGASCCTKLSIMLHMVWEHRSPHWRVKRGTYRPTVAHHIRRNDPEAQIHEQRDLVAPAQ